jgi:Cd2+/Zn2+-exporting ATPase
MTKKEKKKLNSIIICTVLMLAALLLERMSSVPQWASICVFLLAYLAAGADVLLKAFSGIRSGEIFDENFLMAVATVGAILLGDYREAVSVMLFYQIGELFQSLAVSRSRKNIAALMDIRPDTANLETEDGILTVDPEEVAEGSVIIVRTGEKIPIDGTVIEGSGVLNTAALTGESKPRSVSEGDAVISGCVNNGSLLRIRTTKTFSDSTVSKILDLVENSSLKKARSEAFITRFARYYTPAVCISALLLAVIPSLVTGDWRTWIHRALTFLVISCPCALLLSIPLVFFGSIGGASRSGILIKGGTDVESISAIGTVVLDKTGTLTEGSFSVSGLYPADGISEEELILTAALAETYSTHPIAAAIREYAGDIEVPSDIREASDIAGHGVKTVCSGNTLLAGNRKLMTAEGIAFTENELPGTVVYVAANGKYLGSIIISDTVKPSAPAAINALSSSGISCIMLTGDNRESAAIVADALGITDYRADLLPEDKVTAVESIIAERTGKGTVAFVGDGINDAPVLMRADVGIAMGALGSDAAIEAADAVLMDDDLGKICNAIDISRRCMRVVKENIAFALGVKALCLILGSIGRAGMWAAIFADVGVMILSVINSARLLKKE